VIVSRFVETHTEVFTENAEVKSGVMSHAYRIKNPDDHFSHASMLRV
jgi:hypothetical protein